MIDPCIRCFSFIQIFFLFFNKDLLQFLEEHMTGRGGTAHTKNGPNCLAAFDHSVGLTLKGLPRDFAKALTTLTT